MWPLGMEGGVARRNWAASAAPLDGEGVEGMWSSPRLGFGWSCGWQGRRWGHAAATGGASRWNRRFGEKTGAVGSQKARGARVLQGRGARDVAALRDCPEGTARQRRRARRGGNGVRERGGTASGFIAREHEGRFVVEDPWR
jgi:hypothetical protein